MSTTTIADRDSRPAVAWLARTLGFAALVALAGLLVGLGVLRATNVFELIPRDGPQLWVGSRCGLAEAAARAALHATPEAPVFLVPLDQDSETMRSSCRSTLAALDHAGYRWLRYFPEPWLCRRLADDAKARLGESDLVPKFYVDGEHVCDGICEQAFARLGHPELAQFVTLFRPSSPS